MIIILLTGGISYATDGVDFNLGKTILKLIFYTLIFIGVVILTIYGTRFIAKSSGRFINSNYMKVIDILKLDPNTKIAIIKISETVYILAMTNNTIEVLDKLSEDEIQISSNRQFEEELDRYRYNSIEKNRYISKFQRKISELLKDSNKLIDEEEKNNEKMG